MPENISAPVETTYDVNQKRMIDLLKIHQRYVMAGRATEAQIESAANALIEATSLMLRIGSKAVFDIMWDYHNNEKNGACSETRALKGFVRFSKAKSYSAAIIYNVFRAVVQQTAWSTYNPAISKLPNGSSLIHYLEQKAA